MATRCSTGGRSCTRRHRRLLLLLRQVAASHHRCRLPYRIIITIIEAVLLLTADLRPQEEVVERPPRCSGSSDNRGVQVNHNMGPSQRCCSRTV